MSGRLPRDPDSGWDEEKERREEMTDIDVSKIKVGDTVSAVVAQVDKDGVYLAPTGRWLPTPCIVSHTPAPRPPLKVGDRVKTPLIGDRTVIWIDGDLVWLSPAARGPSLPHHLSEIELWERLS